MSRPSTLSTPNRSVDDLAGEIEVRLRTLAEARDGTKIDAHMRDLRTAIGAVNRIVDAAKTADRASTGVVVPTLPTLTTEVDSERLFERLAAAEELVAQAEADGDFEMVASHKALLKQLP